MTAAPVHPTGQRATVLRLTPPNPPAIPESSPPPIPINIIAPAPPKPRPATVKPPKPPKVENAFAVAAVVEAAAYVGIHPLAIQRRMKIHKVYIASGIADAVCRKAGWSYPDIAGHIYGMRRNHSAIMERHKAFDHATYGPVVDAIYARIRERGPNTYAMPTTRATEHAEQIYIATCKHFGLDPEWCRRYYSKHQPNNDCRAIAHFLIYSTGAFSYEEASQVVCPEPFDHSRCIRGVQRVRREYRLLCIAEQIAKEVGVKL